MTSHLHDGVMRGTVTHKKDKDFFTQAHHAWMEDKTRYDMTMDDGYVL